MYESFYKFQRTPFRLTPDPHFFFGSGTHKRGLAYLRYAFQQNEGFVVITGAPGTGKTELMLNLVNDLPERHTLYATVVSTNLTANDLLDLVAASFKISFEDISKGGLLKRLEVFFKAQASFGKQILLLIDEAHNLSKKSLIELSMLSNFQLGDKAVLQCFLLGQEKLNHILDDPDLAHLKQRVIASTTLEALGESETQEYIQSRLTQAGWQGDPHFTKAAFRLTHQFTGGIPRQINLFCSRLLLQGYLEEKHEIDEDIVFSVIEELFEETAVAHAPYRLDEQLVASMKAHSDHEYETRAGESRKPIESQSTPKETIELTENIDTQFFLPASLPNTSLPNNSAVNSDGSSNSNIVEHEVLQELIHHGVNRLRRILTDEGKVDENLRCIAKLIIDRGLKEKLHQNKPSISSDAPDRRDLVLRPLSRKDHFNSTLSGLLPSRKTLIFPAIATSLIAFAVYVENREDLQSDSNRDIHESPIALQSENPKPLSKDNIQINQDLSQSVPLLMEESPSLAMLSGGRTDVGNVAYNDQAFDTVILPSESPSQDRETGDTLADNPASSESSIQNHSIDSRPITTEKTDSIKNEDLPRIDSKSDGSAQSEKTALVKPRKVTSHDPGDSVSSKDAQPPTPEVQKDNSNPTSRTNNNKRDVKIAKKKTNQEYDSKDALVNQVIDVPSSREQTAASASHSTVFDSNGLIINAPGEKAAPNSFNINDMENISISSKRNEITDSQLETLISSLTRSYKNGNLQKLIRIFSLDALSNGESNINEIENDYRRLFSVTDKRDMAIKDVRWSKHNGEMLGRGDFKLTIREKGAGNTVSYDGSINLNVKKEGDSIVITRLTYQYKE